MFRLQFHYQVRLGEFRQFYDLFEQLDKVVIKKGLHRSTLWGGTVGNLNNAVTFTEYETISDFWNDVNAFQADPDCMNLWRQMGRHVEGIPRSELWESAVQIA